MKSFVIFAGVNGAGKTTLYQTNEEYMELPRVNLDEIVRNIGSWKSEKDVANETPGLKSQSHFLKVAIKET